MQDNEIKFNELATLRANTYNTTDRDKILDAMLRLGSYNQLATLRANTYNTTDRDKILDAMLATTENKKNTTNIRKPKYSPKKKYDVFISHASEDKDFAAPLAKSLSQKGFEVWYDDFILKLGDSLQQEIDIGLANSRYGIVILSRNFFKKNWPLKELDGLAAKETAGRRLILPIWRNITKDEVASHSPTLAGLKAAPSRMGIAAITQMIAEVISL